MIKEEEGTNKKIFRDLPHKTFDKYFSGSRILDCTGNQGFSRPSHSVEVVH